MSDDRPRSGSGGSSVPQVLFQGEVERNGSDKMEFLLMHLPKLVSEYTWQLQNEFAKTLDPIKRTGNDWRAVASRLQFSLIIPQLEQTQNPTVRLLRECTETTSKELLEILVDEKRTDVLEGVSKFISKNLEQFGPKCPTQESVLDGSFCSGLSWPLQDSGNASSLVDSDVSQRRLGPQESEEKDENFFSDESQKFWLNIPGDYEWKSWKNFSQAAKNWCPDEMQQGNVEKFLCHVLHIEYGQRNNSDVKLDRFLVLVALFGPFKAGTEGCLQKMYDLMKKSISLGEGGTKESWFAGYMNETVAEASLGNQTPGHFLVRVSSSRDHEGVFVLAVKTCDSGVIQIQIERDLQDNALLLAHQKFSDLMSLVNILRRNVLLQNCPQLLINPCPGLPLNAIFSGYVEGTARRRGRGRGRHPR